MRWVSFGVGCVVGAAAFVGTAALWGAFALSDYWDHS
jgi:hypothetical protein